MIETTNESQAVLELNDVWRSYKRNAENVDAVRGVSLQVAMGEFVAVVGRSGSGKSTLLHIAGALDLADRGEVRIVGARIAGMSTRQRAALRRTSVGFVFQFFHLLPHLTVQENVELPLLFIGSFRSRQRAAEVLGSVGLSGLEKRFPSELSGGEMQRVAVARAIVTKPAIVLADEPTGNLDSATGSEIIALLESLTRQRGGALVMVTHDREAASRADRTLVMDDGRISEC
ncbi:MAG TPA: ABC transporter ATP-binding protein [Acidimicrobiales bacterium]|nr:ABC transporter ATP-binding protein [Acidimicrobiales bacterium]